MAIFTSGVAYVLYLAWKQWKKNHRPNLNLIHNEAISCLRTAQYNLQEAEDRLTLAQTQSWNKPTSHAIKDLQLIQGQIAELVNCIYATNEQHNQYLKTNNLTEIEDWEHIPD